ncbi:MAG TPA: hypothetical protein DEV93_02500 [Chloroflexi bacterium]|nr:hypothetical protein [Chloroflexota bacterium]
MSHPLLVSAVYPESHLKGIAPDAALTVEVTLRLGEHVIRFTRYSPDEESFRWEGVSQHENLGTALEDNDPAFDGAIRSLDDFVSEVVIGVLNSTPDDVPKEKVNPFRKNRPGYGKSVSTKRHAR